MKKLITLILALSVSSGALAASDHHLATSMLSQIFGYIPPLTGHMGVMNFIIQKINLAIFALVGLYCSYSTAMIVYDVFQGGLQGGKSNNIMMAGRLALAAALLAPLPAAGYYSTYQTIVMRVVVGGIDLANNVWDLTMDKLADGLSLDSNLNKIHGTNSDTFTPFSGDPTASGTMAFTSTYAYQVVQGLLAQDMCMRYSSALAQQTGVEQAQKSLGYQFSTSSDGKNFVGFPGGFDKTQVGPLNTSDPNTYGCGYFRYDQYPESKKGQSDAAATILQGQQMAAEQVLSYIDPVVQEIVSDSGSQSVTLDIAGPPVPGAIKFKLTQLQAQELASALSSAQVAYANTMGTLVFPLQEGQTNNQNLSNMAAGDTKLGEWEGVAKKGGFLMAGNFVYQLSSQDQAGLIPKTSDITAPDVGSLFYLGTDSLEKPFTCSVPGSTCQTFNSFMKSVMTWPSTKPTSPSLRTSAKDFGNQPLYDAKIPYNIWTENSPIMAMPQFIDATRYYGANSIDEVYREKSSSDNVAGTANQRASAASMIASPILSIIGIVFPIVGMVSKITLDFIIQPSNPFAFMHQIGMDLLQGAGILIFGNAINESIRNTMLSGEIGTCYANLVEGADSLDERVKPLVITLYLYMIVTGLFLVYVVPLMPFMYYLFAILGWIMCVVEAIFAGTVMPILLADPGGQHPFWGRAEIALMLLLNIYLQPVLIVMGLITSVLLSFVAMRLLNLSFGAVVNNSFSNLLGFHMPSVNLTYQADPGEAGRTLALGIGLEQALNMAVANGGAAFKNIGENVGVLMVGLASIPLVIGLYALMVYQIMSFCFSLIHTLPMKISRWIGVQPHQSEAAQAVQSFTGSISQAKQRFGGSYFMYQGKGGDKNNDEAKFNSQTKDQQ